MRFKLTDDDLTAAEAVIGHAFGDRSILARALTHSSADGLRHGGPLATVGDSIHRVWIARRAFSGLERPREDVLTYVIKHVEEGRTAQAPLLFGLGLDEYVVLGGSKKGDGYRVTEDMAATTYEALIAAIEIDAGYQAAEDFMDRVGGAQLESVLSRFRKG